MRIALCYITVTHGPITADYCSRFVASYLECPPGFEHDTFVCCNGGPLSHEIGLIFDPLRAKFFPRVNDSGWDIAAYIEMAGGPCRSYDMMLCMGESCYFHRQDWLRRFASAWQKHGPGMYGPFASNLVRPHLNTTCFCSPPAALLKYPRKINNRADRYEFEHGHNPFWKAVLLQGMPVRLVTWDGEWMPGMWRYPNNILWRGDQSNCLVWCNHTERFAKADIRTKQRWSSGADSRRK